jgi:hypothetical protein
MPAPREKKESPPSALAPERDDDQARRGRLLHLGKGEALAYRVARQARC